MEGGRNMVYHKSFGNAIPNYLSLTPIMVPLNLQWAVLRTFHANEKCANAIYANVSKETHAAKFMAA